MSATESLVEGRGEAAMTSELVLPRVLAERAQLLPDRVFFQEVGGVTLTYSELDSGISTWAAAFDRAGIGADDVVAVMLPNGPDTILVWMGLAWLGGLELPINTSFKGQMLVDVMTASQARIIVVHERYLARVREVVPSLPRLERIIVTGGAEPSDDLNVPMVSAATFLDGVKVEPRELDHLAPQDTCCIVWTSGTTGPSKGVLVTWAQLHAMGTAAFPAEELSEDDALYSPFPMFYVGGKLFLCLVAAINGRLVMKDRFNTATFWDEIREYGCTCAPLNPATTYFLYKQPARPDDADTPLRNVLLAPIIPEIRDFCERFGVRVHTVYNSTEISCPIVSGWDPPNLKSCGRVRPGYSVRVVDENDYEVGPGEVGELLVRADRPWTLMKGYWGRPDATVAAWRNLWFHTGDAFTYDEDGNFFFVDRLKDAIRRRGQNISSAEVEAAVNQHPAVNESAVVAAPSEFGEDEVRAVITLLPGSAATPLEIFEFVRDRLPRFMLPRFIDIVDDLPKTETEKVQKGALRSSGLSDTTWDREAAGIKVQYEG